MLYYDLDPAHYFTLPGYGWDAMLLKTGIELDLISDMDMYLMIEKGIRVELDDRSERLSAKIRDAQLMKIPYMLVMGDKEAQDQTVAVRTRTGGAQEVRPLSEFVEAVAKEISSRS